MRSEKAQSTIDFITANLGVLMLILLLVMLLFYIGIANTSTTQYRCDLGASFSCRSMRVSGLSGLTLQVGQASGMPVVINAVSCGPYAEKGMNFVALESPTYIPHGDFKYVSGGDSHNYVQCAGAVSGKMLVGSLCLGYTRADLGVNHSVCGDVITLVE